MTLNSNMKKTLLGCALTIISFNLFSQFQAGVNSGIVFPNLEENGMYNASYNIETNLYYKTPINWMIGLHYYYIGKMNLSDKWAINKLTGGYVDYNTAYMEFYPTLFLSLNYILSNSDKTFVYVGVNAGKINYSANGGVKTINGGSSMELEFEGEKHSDFTYSPKIGFTRPIVENLRWQFEFKYNIVKSEYRYHLISFNLGLLYAIQRRRGNDVPDDLLY